VLYRVAYLFVVTDPVSVADLGDLLRNMGGTFLLYLRVSGQFHLIVGILHLFGYRLPETHHLYYLSRSFTDLWRRINIYWKDFMLQQVFYPTYFRMKGGGARSALVWSTAMVFAVTWILHSYQWFWLRGGFPISANDILFWGILGALVVFGALREAAQPTRGRRAPGFDSRAGLEVMRTFAVFCVLWSLWSTESVGHWLWMISSGATLDVGGLVLLGSLLAALFLLGGWNWDAGLPVGARWLGGEAGNRRRRLSTLGVLVVISVPAADVAMPQSLAGSLAGLRDNRLNARDAALQHRGGTGVGWAARRGGTRLLAR
jgi:hypothetical protein